MTPFQFAGHRRRTTTTTSTQATSTSIESEATTEVFKTTDFPEVDPTYPKLPKPLRLTSVLEEYDDVHIDNIIEEAKLIERRVKHIDKEIMEEIDETSLSKSQNKVKKMYRDSAGSAVNKLSAKGGKSGIFLTENCTTVIAQIGTTAILHCEVSDITENTVRIKYNYQ